MQAMCLAGMWLCRDGRACRAASLCERQHGKAVPPCPAHPAAPPRWEGLAPEPLTQQALTALAAQDAATHDQHLRLLRFDDRMAELVSCRWVVQGVRRDRACLSTVLRCCFSRPL